MCNITLPVIGRSPPTTWPPSPSPARFWRAPPLTPYTPFCKTLHICRSPAPPCTPRPPRCTGRAARCANTIPPSMLAAGAAPVRAWNTEKVRCSKSEEKVFKERGRCVQRKMKRCLNGRRCSKSEEKLFKEWRKCVQRKRKRCSLEVFKQQLGVRSRDHRGGRVADSPLINITPPNKHLQPRWSCSRG